MEEIWKLEREIENERKGSNDFCGVCDFGTNKLPKCNKMRKW